MKIVTKNQAVGLALAGGLTATLISGSGILATVLWLAGLIWGGPAVYEFFLKRCTGEPSTPWLLTGIVALLFTALMLSI